MSENQKTLTVLFGAGASHDCHPYRENSERLPQFPLTQNLFQFDRAFDQVNGAKHHFLNKYPGAAAIGRLYTNDNAKGLEEFLRSQLATKDPNKAREVYQTKFFLREYLGHLSECVQTELTRTNYTKLIDYFASLNFDKILLITTNYDLLLDYRLHEHLRWNFDGFEDYLGNNRNGHQNKWFYVKLHGSVNWQKKISMGELDVAMRDNECIDLYDLILNCPKAVLDAKGTSEVKRLTPVVHLPRPERDRDNGTWKKNRFRYDDAEGSFVHAPILLLPYDDKEPVCDKSHFDKVEELIKNTRELWVIGNSLADPHLQELVGLISTNGLKISIVDPANKSDWLNKVRNIFHPNGHHNHHSFTILYRNSACGLSDFIQRGLSFPSSFEKLHPIQNNAFKY